MNDIIIFKNEQFGEIRTMEENGKVLFCGSDVAKALGYAIPTKAVNTHCKGVSKMEAPTTSGVQTMLFIPEGDVYRLITHSKLPEAQKFESWVFDEVLPSVRKHGGYIAGQEEMSGEELMARAILFAERKIKEQAEQIALMEPKASYFDRVAESKGSLCFRDTAKAFGVKEKEFIQFLLDHKLVYRNSHRRLVPYAEGRKNKWFEVSEFTYTKGTEITTSVQTKITPTGRQKIHAMMAKEGM
ncbi:MAG: phage antirepressor KilAC domain-containing protein [Clostridia bacterium]|nr:phage antirepressor KilAC domain-containing protein [Clostridia bacterium]